MSKDILNGMIAIYDRANGLLEKFIEICPEKIWAEPKGKFPVWQHVYHCYSSAGFFLAGEGNKPVDSPFAPAVASFDEIPAIPGDKATIAAYGKDMDAFIRAYFATLNDADLGKLNEGLSDRIKAPMSHSATISLLIGHIFYHFGHCDAA
ncbi:DinB family protein, partial [Desulfovibrio sp. OttesenSCG-928-C06]|nr:DinB family protein [Desulfovibrio sp. OttesenSCG-928-C06]